MYINNFKDLFFCGIVRSINIGLDVDGTVLDFMTPLINYMVRIGIEVPKYEETNDLDLSVSWGCGDKEVRDRILRFYGSNEFKSVKPLTGVKENFDLLFPPHNAYVLTMRPPIVEECTRSFFETYLGKYLESFHLGQFHKKEDGSPSDFSKFELVRRLRKDGIYLDLFVEDSLHEAESISRLGIPVLLINSPWNIGRPTRNGITRVDNWEQITVYVEKFASESYK